ncbi:MAG: hypothetical protein V3U71_02195 [Cocleimonas sp.]
MTTIRKNFVLEEGVANHLEELSQVCEQSMTYLVQDMIEERYKKLKVNKRMQALERMSNSASGLLTNKSVQSIKVTQAI